MVGYKPEEPINCPMCGGCPATTRRMYGKMWSAHCDTCGWQGETIAVELSPQSAIDSWNIKAQAAQQESRA